MKNEIEELNLIYGVTIYKIMCQYKDIYTSNQKERNLIYKFINDFFIWLETQENINSNNVVLIGTELLENYDIRKNIQNLNETNLHNISIKIINKLNLQQINNLISNKNNYLVIPFKKEPSLNGKNFYEIIDENIYSKDLIYTDLIQLFIANYQFPKKIGMMGSYNYCLNTLNNLNILFYLLNEMLDSDRSSLYYLSLIIFQHKHSKDYLLTNSLSRDYNIDSSINSIKSYLCGFIIRSLHFFNKYYCIEIPKLNYNNSAYFIPNSEENYELFEFALKDLNYKQKCFIFDIGSRLTYAIKNCIITTEDLDMMNSIISVYKKNSDMKILSQKTDDKYQKLITKNADSIPNYCYKNNIPLENFVCSLDFNTSASKTFIEFTINNNNFEYKFALRKFNNKFSWNVKLKKGSEYKIYLYLEDDYKHIIQAIYND